MSVPTFLTAPELVLPGVRHAFFTRRGGVSTGIYAGLNLGAGSADDPEAVVENCRRAAAALGVPALVTAFQVHSARAVVTDGAWPGPPPEADAVVTAMPGVACTALAADCAPILFADPQARVVAAAHAGWKGALAGVVEATVAAMETLGADRARVTAVIGPCIQQVSYEVGLELLERFTGADPASEAYFGPGRDSAHRQFDLPGFVLSRLSAAGVGTCASTGHDTCAQPDLFHSNRRALLTGEADYGRLGSAILLT